ncbi:splicing factor 3B subunit 1 isoform X1 [Hydra vulgaris]|uniref:splicing factor 3B subunit 1 isoform X1 n=1 Tax=Hydra vulgaris TaxID=6087 RepID=UPI001F5F3A5D|nr:splicing factor 3B subunit 1 isoform X1 [Hydra vulgaris]
MAAVQQDIESQIKELQNLRGNKINDKDEETQKKAGIAFGTAVEAELYGTASDKYAGYDMSIATNDQEEDEDDYSSAPLGTSKLSSFTAPQAVLKDLAKNGADVDPFAATRKPTIAERQNEYQQRMRNLMISPARVDPFADGGKTPDPKLRSYHDVLKEQKLIKDQAAVVKKIQDKAKAGELKVTKPAKKRSGRWDQPSGEEVAPKKKWDQVDTPSSTRWDETPGRSKGAETPGKGGDTPGTVQGSETPAATPIGEETPGRTPGATPKMSWEATPSYIQAGSTTPGNATPGGTTPSASSRRKRWDETPGQSTDTPGRTPGWAETPRTDRQGSETPGMTPTPHGSKRKSRWDETPQINATPGSGTPHATPAGSGMGTPAGTPSIVGTPGVTPGGTLAMQMQTPTPGHLISMTPEQMQAYRWEKEIDERNRPLTDDELDTLMPFEGYKVLQPPANYQPIRTPARKLIATPTPLNMGTGFRMQTDERGNIKGVIDEQPPGNLPSLKPDDYQYFDKLLVDVDETTLSAEEQRERKIMKLLLKIKNGTPPMRKAALRQVTDKAREFGAGPLFNQILPLLMSPTLEDQERHLLVKVIDRILYKLDDLVRPYVHKILVVIEPLLIDEDYYARVEGREIISNLAKAAGLATMISTMRPDIDNIDEYVRNTTARAFAVVASALGIPSLLPFLKAVCKSKKSWQARHTGIKIVQQIAILMGCAILPHLRNLVEIIEHGLIDEQQKVRTITALAIAALAEAATPYGIESFDSVLKPLWKGIKQHRGKGLAAFLKAIGYLIPLMDAEYAYHYTREVMIILIREFQSPDEEMKKIVLKVVKQCCATDGVEANYIKEEILPEFFKHFWTHRMALDRRNYRQLVDTTVEVANKVGAAHIIGRVVDDLKDENEQYRKMVLETIEKVMSNLGASEVDSRLEEQLIDGILYAFQEQTNEDVVMLNGFGTVVNAFGARTKPYLPQICGTILWRLNNKSAKVRQQAADLIARISYVMKLCGEEKLMGHLGVVLYEYLGEEYPEVLGSILGALKSIVNVIGMNKMTPPIKDLLPRLTPILKNRHEKVQENCIDLVGRIADRGAEHVSAREWMRICFELLELLKAHKKAIRRATVNTFGYIAKAIGPQDVLATLLNNLKVQERQNRVCTTVAIAIVAETCSPFTVLPALMNEYRVPELNVQNGVLKSLSFLFEYIGEMGKDYIYAVTPLLEDALMDRDLVHRQTACAAIKHMAIGVCGFGCEDSLTHLMNYVWPNVFETSPHVINAVIEAIEGMRVGLGPLRLLQYVLQGLFHPARKVRDVYWKIYNGLYIASQDALVAGYPSVPNEGENNYLRTELHYFL